MKNLFFMIAVFVCALVLVAGWTVGIGLAQTKKQAFPQTTVPQTAARKNSAAQKRPPARVSGSLPVKRTPGTAAKKTIAVYVDLAVENFRLTTAAPVPAGQAFTLAYTLVNRGTQDTKPKAWLDSLYMKPRLSENEFDLVSQQNSCAALTLLPAGRSCAVSQSMRVKIPGAYTFTISVDDQNAVQESDESNNKKSVEVIVR